MHSGLRIQNDPSVSKRPARATRAIRREPVSDFRCARTERGRAFEMHEIIRLQTSALKIYRGPAAATAGRCWIAAEWVSATRPSARNLQLATPLASNGAVTEKYTNGIFRDDLTAIHRRSRRPTDVTFINERHFANVVSMQNERDVSRFYRDHVTV